MAPRSAAGRGKFTSHDSMASLRATWGYLRRTFWEFRNTGKWPSRFDPQGAYEPLRSPKPTLTVDLHQSPLRLNVAHLIHFEGAPNFGERHPGELIRWQVLTQRNIITLVYNRLTEFLRATRTLVR
jgi:hypothetical protein